MKKLWKWLFETRKQQCNIHDVSKSVCLLKYKKNECERYNTVKTCKHCPWEQTVC